MDVFVNFFFFFQAEDGIRDDLVTGVQTCALPICWGSEERAPCPEDVFGEATAKLLRGRRAFLLVHEIREAEGLGPVVVQRSEERRVGKECRSRWSREQ